MTAKKTKKEKRIPAWTALHFSLANAEGRGQGNVPHLLNRLAAEIRSLGELEVLDITFQTEITAEGNRPQFTVYYYRPRTKAR